MKAPRVLIAGGGTGGHLFPGIAIAEEICSRGGEVSFVGTARGIESRVLPRLGMSLDLIKVRGLVRTTAADRLRFILEAPLALHQVAGILRRRRPQVVVGVGGYASGPVVLSAAVARMPTAILEQNTIPGITNRILGRLADRVYASFEESLRFFPQGKVEVTGNPVRRDIVEALGDAARRTSSGDGRLRLLVFGGSQGARFLNERLMEAAHLLSSMPIALVHQTGEADQNRVTAAYRAARLDAEVVPFIDNMATRYAAADLVLCRAGATTLAELAIASRPAILVPFPYATHGHQEKNARELESRGAAICRTQSELNASRLAELLGELAADQGRRAAMAKAMGALGRPAAAAAIVDGLTAQVRRRRGQ